MIIQQQENALGGEGEREENEMNGVDILSLNTHFASLSTTVKRMFYRV